MAEMPIKNDFEESVFKNHVVIRGVKAALYEAGALFASMSGERGILSSAYLSNGARPVTLPGRRERWCSMIFRGSGILNFDCRILRMNRIPIRIDYSPVDLWLLIKLNSKLNIRNPKSNSRIFTNTPRYAFNHVMLAPAFGYGA